MTHEELPYIAIIEDLNELIRKQMKAINALMYLARPHGYESTDEMYWKQAIRDTIEKELK